MMYKNRIPFLLFLFATIAMVLPALSIFGVKIEDKMLSGVESKTKRPNLIWSDYFSQKYQKNFDIWYGQNFSWRPTVYRTRYQLYEWANFGEFHAGYRYSVFTLSNGALAEKTHLPPYFYQKQVSIQKYQNVLSEIAKLQSDLRKRGIDFIFVLAPSKLTVYPAELPWYFRVFGKINIFQWQKKFAQFLDQYKIKYWNAEDFLIEQREKSEELFFPYAGTHWNAVGASISMQKILEEINKGKKSLPYRVNQVSSFARSRYARYKEDDIGTLLNLHINPFLKKNLYYNPVFENYLFHPNCGNIILFGDSYCHKLQTALTDAQHFRPGNILICDKQVPDKNVLLPFTKDLRCVVLVYTGCFSFFLPEFFEIRIKNFHTQLLELGTRGILPETYKTYENSWILQNNIEYFFGKGTVCYRTVCGFSGVEPWGMWSDGACAEIYLATPARCRNLILLIRPFLSANGTQKIGIKVNDVFVKEVIFTSPKEQKVILSVPKGAKGSVKLNFSISNPTSPMERGMSTDARKLGFGLISCKFGEI